MLSVKMQSLLAMPCLWSVLFLGAFYVRIIDSQSGAGSDFCPHKSKPQPAAKRPLRVILSLSLLAVSTALPILLPVPVIPTPSGPYPIGTRTYELTDESRKELYSGKDEARRSMIQVWYPTEADTSTEKARWMDNAEIYAPAVSQEIGMPSYFLGHLALVKVPA